MYKLLRAALPGNFQSRFEISFRCLAMFKPRDILTETSDETGTLLTRFAKHLALENHRSMPLVPTTIRYVDYFPVTEHNYFIRELTKTPAEQIPALIIFSSTYRPNAEPNRFADILNALDKLAIDQISRMDADTVLRVLYSLLFVVPNWVTRFDFYHKAMQRLVENDFSQDVDKEKFIQLCFYLGLSKKQANGQKLLQKFLAAHLEQHLDGLNAMDVAVVCNAAYKTSTPVQSDSYNQRLKAEVLNMTMDGLDDALLVTYIKAMRFQRIHSMEVCEYLSNLCNNEAFMQRLQMRGLVHVFAYFAENLWDDEGVVKAMPEHFLSNLGSGNRFSSQTGSVRAKDLATFLWCCAHLDCKLDDADLQRIETVLLNKVQYNQFRFFPDQLVDACISLWSLGRKSLALWQQAIALKTEKPANLKEQPKVESRFTILLNIASIEEPKSLEEFKSLKTKKKLNLKADAPDYITKQRADITALAEKLSQEQGVSATKLICPIEGINIPSILVELNEQKEKLFIELLNDKQILHFSKAPINLIRIKERLLESLGHKVILLHSSDLAKSYTNLKDLTEAGSVDNDAPAPERNRKTTRSV